MIAGLRPSQQAEYRTLYQGQPAVSGSPKDLFEEARPFLDLEGGTLRVDDSVLLAGSSERMLTASFSQDRAPAAQGLDLTLPAAKPGGGVTRGGAPRPWPGARARQVRKKSANLPGSAATRLRGRPLLRKRSTARGRKTAA